MDNFDENFLNTIINKSKLETISKLESMEICHKDLEQHADLLCFVPEYSPRISDRALNRSK